MRILITGITGFVGSHLAEYALEKNVEVYGADRWRSKTENIDHIKHRLHLIESDLKDLSSVHSLLQASRPDWVFHLAAQSFVGASWHAPTETLHNNIMCQVNLLEAIRVQKLDVRFLAVGSSEEYGLVYENELPIKETNALRPLSPYAVSKVTQDLMGYQYWKSYGLHIVRSRAFNHEGPRRGDVFVTSNFAKQIAEIEAGFRKPVVYVGNLSARRDYSDVRDILKGYWLLLEKGEPGEVYNLASGRAWSIRQVLDFLLGQSRVPQIGVEEDPARLRPSDVPTLVGDSTKVEKITGWRTQIQFEKTLTDLLEYWRQRVKAVAT